ncbi:hypothetical protein [Microbulbifer sp. VAAF005]|uniref:hypothetical protein n=1 Tax=Microbulbifer sp. VAAF005 TaxID=3034230 RepID=UPI0024AD535F|nr:hypothetical protein [Microbulbifer sp. VAAF005]WHI46787.1 hypothetical protein P0078_24335 [Microbulbifer sp. VAAF005]
MTTQLFAAIRENSKYFSQNPPPHQMPFPVRVINTSDAYRVMGNSDRYRLDDVYLFVKAGHQYRQINS